MKAFITNFSATLFMIFAILVIGSLQFSKLPISLYPETTRPIFQTRNGVSPEYRFLKE